ncbi:MAG: type II/IV secretion system protein [Kiritimatiellae bacterium]|nr:type II/IV secretion system protein [Kiritimatiellia bacterium]
MPTAAPQNEPSPAAELDQLKALAAQYRLDWLETVPSDSLDSTLVTEVPVEWARAHGVLPVRYRGELCVLTADPRAIGDQEYLALILGAELRPLLAPRREIARSIETCYFSKADRAEDFIRDLAEPAPDRTLILRETDDLLKVADQAPVTQLVNLILLEAVKAGASDIHFEPYEARLRVRFRIDGMLYDQTAPPKHLQQELISRLKIMARMDTAERRLPQDGMARVRVGEREIDIRASTLPVAEGERMVLRLLNRESALLPLTALGMSTAALDRFRALLRETHGIIVVAGPTGSGKTTTLYAALQELDTQKQNILTIEEPIEYQLPNIGQMQVKPKIGLTFANGLRHILRQDPDIILVGETRDLETAQIAVRASLTGHLVFTTLHTNDASDSVIRLVDMGIEPYRLAASLRAVLAQRLVRRLCPECRRRVVATAADLAALGPAAARLQGASVWTAGGCGACLAGYKGRTGVFELIALDAAMREHLRREDLAVERLREAAARKGMTSMLDDGVEKVRAGQTSIAELVRALGESV